MNIEELKNKYPAQKPMTDVEAEYYLDNLIKTGALHGMNERAVMALRHNQRRIEKLKRIEREYDLEIGDIEK